MKTIGKHLYRHLFLYSFLLIQAAFLIWVVAGVNQAPSIPAHCLDANGNVNILAGNDCASDVGGQVGTAIGVGLVIGLWIALDVVTLLGRVVVLLTRRSRRDRSVTVRRPDVVGVDSEDFPITGGGSPRFMKAQTLATPPSDFSSLNDD